MSVIGVGNHRAFESAASESTTSIDGVYDTSSIRGFNQGYDLLEPLADLREPGGSVPSSGVYACIFGGVAPPQEGIQSRHYDAEVAGFIDLYYGARVLALRAAHESLTGDLEERPLANLPRLGGPQRLRGYDLNRFRDRMSMLATVECRWPVHEFVQAVGFVDAGSVGEAYFEMLDPKSYRIGVGGGFILGDRDTRLLALEIGYGDGPQVLITSNLLLAFKDRSEQL